MNNVFGILFFVFLCFSCSKKIDENLQNTLIPKKNIQLLLDSFVMENKSDNFVYELYIDKIDPHNYNLILYAGEKSLTEEENKDQNQYPVASTLTSEGVRVYIFSGVEHYFDQPSKQSPFLSTDIIEGNRVMWAIRDSFGILSRRDLEEGYPFLPLPEGIESGMLTPPMVDSSISNKKKQ